MSATGSGERRHLRRGHDPGRDRRLDARHNLSAADFAAQNAAAQSANMIPLCVSIYGDPGSPAYAGIWRANPGFTKWLVNPADPAPSYQATFDTDTQLPGYTLNGWRPAYVAVSSDQTYCSVYKDDIVGPWVARHGLSAAQYQAEFNAQLAAGRYPIFVQGGGSGNNIVYTAVFAAQDQPTARQWTVTGTAVPAQRRHRRRHGDVHAGQRRARGPGGLRARTALSSSPAPTPGPSPATGSRSRATASFSPAAPRCSARPSSSPSSTPVPCRRPTRHTPSWASSNPADPRSDQITIQQLLDHTGGYDDTIPPYFDPTYNMGQIAQSLGVSPLTRLDVCKYMYGQPLQHDPGTTYAYSNYGYLLLAAVADAVTPQRDYYTLPAGRAAPAGGHHRGRDHLHPGQRPHRPGGHRRGPRPGDERP